ncbi:MAG: hypothetical protein MK082_10450 [Phycisphaerales bacterium]|nr:hypothetical protein [Phycisphaerales bacterium]
MILRLRKDRWAALRASIGVDRIEVVETRSFPLEELSAEEAEDGGSANSLINWLEAEGSPRTYLLLPAGITISRVLPLSADGDAEDLDLSLRLQAESHLLGGASAHRICMASLPKRSDSANQGLVITWPESSKVQLPLLVEDPSCITETTALLAMLPEGPLEGPMLHVERSTGSLALVLEHEGQLAVRSTREEAHDGAAWQKAIVHSVVETAITNHQPTEDVQALRDTVMKAMDGQEELLLLPDAAREHVTSRVSGGGDDDWWQEWGICAGALLASSGRLQPLTSLRPRKPIESANTFGEITASLARPMTAACILIGAFFAIALLPLITSWLRLAIIEAKVDDQKQLEKILQTTKQQEAVYNEIANRSWPMTKVLGDVANCMPLGIETDQITANEGDAVIIRGSVGPYGGKTPKEILYEMQVRLDDVGIFGPWDLSEDPINSGGKIDFTISIPVITPFKYVRNFSEDFAEKSHGERRYAETYARIAALEAEKNGESGASATSGETTDSESAASDASAPAETTIARADNPRSGSSSSSRDSRDSAEDEGGAPPGVGRESLSGVRGGSTASRRSSSSSSSSRAGSIRGSSGSAVRRSDASGAVSTGGEAPVPEILTDTELAALSKPEAQEELKRVSMARRRTDLDEETKAALRTYFDRILEHMKSIPNTGGSL